MWDGMAVFQKPAWLLHFGPVGPVWPVWGSEPFYTPDAGRRAREPRGTSYNILSPSKTYPTYPTVPEEYLKSGHFWAGQV